MDWRICFSVVWFNLDTQCNNNKIDVRIDYICVRLMFCGLHSIETLYLKLDYKYYNIKYNFSKHIDFVFVIS